MPMSPRRYHPPKSAGGGGAYIGGAAIGRSAANAAVDRVTAPAAIRNLTLRIGFVLLAGEATRKPHIEKSTCGRCQQNLKQHLTLIFKVDIFSPRDDRAHNVTRSPQILTMR